MLYLFQQMKENISNQKGIRMFKYEWEIQEANKEYLEQRQMCLDAYQSIAEWVGEKEIQTEVKGTDENMCRYIAFGDVEPEIDGYEKGILSINARVAIKKYYTFIEGQGYIRTKESNFIDRSDRDKFEKNNIEYPKTCGLYMIGQTFVNPITNEKFYWIKVGEAQNLARRRHDYNSMTAMIWDIGYYTKDDLTESECHDKLKDIALHRHADEWFSVSRENYLKICEQGFEWFKEDE